MMVSHPCKKCPTMLVYNQRTNRRVYCEPCRIAADKASTAHSQKVRRERYGRMPMRDYKALEASGEL